MAECAQLLSFAGEKIGQAAVFDHYELEDGTVVQVTSEAWQPAQARGGGKEGGEEKVKGGQAGIKRGGTLRTDPA